MASYVGSGITISSRSDQSSYTTGTDGGSNYTVGSGSDRLLLIWLIGFTNAASDTKGASAVTHNGQSATNYGALPNNDRTWVELWYIKNPTTGSGGTSVTCVSGQRAFITFAEEFDGVDQTTPIHATFDSYGANSNTHTFTLSPSAGSILSAAVSVRASAGTFAASDGGTLIQSDVTGTLSFNDVSGGLAYENVASSGSNSLTISWTTSNNNSGLMVEVLAAAGGGGTDNLTADDVESASEVSAPVIGQTHALTGTGVESAAEVSAPVLAQVHNLTANDIESASEVSAPVLTDVPANVDNLTAEDIESASEVSAPAIGQIHALTATGVQSVSEVSAPAMTQVHALLALSVQALSEVSAPNLYDGDISARRMASPGGSATGGTFTRSGKGGTVARTFNSGTII